MISRRSFTEQDTERIAETIAQLDFHNRIKNRDDFNNAFDNYMGDTGAELRKDQSVRNRVFNKFVEEYPDRVTQPEDLNETRDLKPIEEKKIKREYNYLGKSGKRIVFLRRGFENRDGRKQVVYRTRDGQIGTPKNPDDKDILK